MILERLKEYIDYKGISISAFEKQAGLANASFRSSLNKGGTIGADKLEKILNVFSDLSPHWLMTGEGSMLKVQAYATAEEAAAHDHVQKADEVAALRERVTELEEQSKNDKALISTLQKALDMAQKIIDHQNGR